VDFSEGFKVGPAGIIQKYDYNVRLPVLLFPGTGQ
jgi:hypothetical protein